MKMRVKLAELQPNPLRDFTVDPIDPEVVAALKDSIEEHGFWGGVACRQLPDGTVEIGAGHHRIQAALEAGLTEADLFVRNNVDDSEMVTLYATENATQRGHTSTALAGTIASAMRLGAKAALTGTPEKFLRGTKSREAALAHLQSGHGIGREIILDILNGVPDEQTKKRPHPIPGINNGSVEQQLVNLKNSGNEARIIAEVEQEIAQEEARAMVAAEEAEREAHRRREEQEVAEREHQRRIKEQLDAEARRIKAEEERKAASSRAREARQEADRTRREAEAQLAEAEQKRREAEAQAASAARIRAEAEAQLAEQRRQEAAEKQQEFEALRQKRKQSRATAKKAADTAAKREKTFDYEGVAKYFRNAHQVDVFRQVVESPGVQPLLPVERQAELAQHIIREAKDRKEELTARFIREHVNLLLTLSKAEDRHISETQKQRLMEQDLRYKEEQLQIDMVRAATALWAGGRKLELLYANDWPEGMEYRLRANFAKALRDAKAMIDACYARLVEGGIVKK